MNFPTLLLEGPSESTEVMEGEALSDDVSLEDGIEDGMLYGEALGNIEGPEDGIEVGVDLEGKLVGTKVFRGLGTRVEDIDGFKEVTRPE